MGWQLINSQIRIPAGIDVGNDHPESDICECFMVGTGNESGYYCFRRSPYVDPDVGVRNQRPFISQQYWPNLHIGNTILRQWGGSYNNAQVYGGDSSNWVFLSKTENSWIRFGQLREPYYYTDIDDTVQGDQFYKGNMPELNSDTPEQWEIQGSYYQWQAGDTISVELKQDIWVWQNNGNRNLRNSGLCGKYYNEQKDTWKMVGVPVFGTYTEASGAYVRREKFRRGAKDTHDHYVYEGDKGHTIHYKNSQWIMGTVGSGKWSEGNEPSLHSGTNVTFTGYEMDEGTGQIVPDPKGDFTILFEYCEMGDDKGLVNMGEVSLWRPTI